MDASLYYTGGIHFFVQMKKVSPQTDLITAGVGASSAPIIKKSQHGVLALIFAGRTSKWNGMDKFYHSKLHRATIPFKDFRTT